MPDNDTKNFSKLLRNIAEGEETAFELVEAIGEGSANELVVKRRQLQPEPETAKPLDRSSDPTHEFHTIDSVERYLDQYGEASTVVVADASKLMATIVIDETRGEGGHQKMTYCPALHPVFKSWLTFFSKPRGVLELAQFALENRRVIKQPDGKQLSFIFGQVQLSKSVEVNTGRGPEQINGVMVKMKVGSGAKDVEVDLPSSISIETPIFLTAHSEMVEFDLLVYGATDAHGNDCVMVKGTCPDITAQMANTFISDFETLRDSMEKGVVTFGSANWTPMKTV